MGLLAFFGLFAGLVQAFVFTMLAVTYIGQEKLRSNYRVALVLTVLGAGLAIGLGAIGSAIGEGYIAMNAMKALGKTARRITKNS